MDQTDFEQKPLPECPARLEILKRRLVKKFKISIALCFLLFVGVVACFGLNGSALLTPSPGAIDPSIVAPVEELGKAFAAIAARVKPAVVSVFSEKMIRIRPEDIPFPFDEELLRDFFSPKSPSRRPGHSREYNVPQMGMGSGMVLDQQGNILTNYHLVHNVDDIKVLFPNQKSFKAKVIGKDAKTDVAIIQIQDRGREKYPTVSWGNSETVEVGDIVLAIGAPFGLTQTVTHGIISAKGRADVGISDFEDFLQTDAPINPGNSGGPLVNARGEIIGMNSAIASSIGQSGGVGFAIPSNMIKAMLPKITKGEAILRGEMGISIQNLTQDLARHFGMKDLRGVLVSQVTPKSNAERAGIKVGDIIIKYEGKPVEDARILRNMVADTLPGSKAKIELVRDQKTRTVTVIISGGAPKATSQSQTQVTEPKSLLRDLGLSVETLTKELALPLQIKEASGVVIVAMDPGSPASIAGLQLGDVIIQVNHQQIENAEDFNKVLAQTKESLLLLLVKRQGASLFVSVQLTAE